MTMPKWSRFRLGRKPSRRRRPTRFRIESLEVRQMMAADTMLAVAPPAAATAVPVDGATETVTAARQFRPAARQVHLEVINNQATPGSEQPEAAVQPNIQAEMPSNDTAAEPSSATQSVTESVGEPSSGSETPVLSQSAVDAVHMEPVESTSDQTAANLANATVFSGEFVDMKAWKDCDVVSDLQGLARKTYDDYSAFRALGNSHKQTCKKLDIKLDSDEAKALERIYNNDVNGKR